MYDIVYTVSPRNSSTLHVKKVYVLYVESADEILLIHKIGLHDLFKRG